jgi:hypothetical protein
VNNHLLKISKELYIPASEVTVDEAMFPFQGRAKETTCIPNKPNPNGFKVWVLAQLGYFISWAFHMPGPKRKRVTVGPQIKGFIPKRAKVSPTASVVPLLLQRLPDWDEYKYHVYLDNLFTSSKLLIYCYGLHIGVTGTARAKAGVYVDIVEVHKTEKKKDNKEHKWGHKVVRYVENGHIAQMGWKDNAFTLFMSTVTDPYHEIPKLRTCPGPTSSKAVTARAPHHGEANTVLPIPLLVDEYNHRMNGVDLGDQYREKITWRRERKHWRNLFWNLLGVTVVNSFILSKNLPGGYDEFTSFRHDLAIGLLRRSERLPTEVGMSILKKRKRASSGEHSFVERTQAF